jgi:hypothetical protein
MSADSPMIVRGEILEVQLGVNMAVGERVYMVRVGYRTPDGVYEQRPFILNRRSLLSLGLEGKAEACVDVTAKWHVLVHCT